jgi:hypothetical protein
MKAHKHIETHKGARTPLFVVTAVALLVLAALYGIFVTARLQTPLRLQTDDHHVGGGCMMAEQLRPHEQHDVDAVSWSGTAVQAVSCINERDMAATETAIASGLWSSHV